VTVRVQSFIWSHHQQRRALHQSTYLYLAEDREPISHQVVYLILRFVLLSSWPSQSHIARLGHVLNLV
jgi:hypothetical protein